MSAESTAFIYREVFIENCYSQHGINVKAGDVVFDVGANIGFYSLQLALQSAQTRVFAFEPIPESFDALNRNMELHGCNNVKPSRAGLSFNCGQANFTYYPYTSISSTMYPESFADTKEESCRYILSEINRNSRFGRLINWLPQSLKMWIAERVRRTYQKGVEVECRLDTVSNVIREEALDRIDLLKIDAEYAEMDILSGVDAEHWPVIGQVIVEVHNSKDDLEPVVNMLKQQGFETVVERSNDELDHLSLVFAKRHNTARS